MKKFYIMEWPKENLSCNDRETVFRLRVLVIKHSILKLKQQRANESNEEGPKNQFSLEDTLSSETDLKKTFATNYNPSLVSDTSFYRDTRSLSTYPSFASQKDYTMEEIFTFESIFQSKVEQYRGTSWVKKVNGQDSLHSEILNQIWLDCYVSDQGFMNLLVNPVQKFTWVGFQDFLKCLEAIHQKTFGHFFFPKRYGKKSKTLFRVQKLLCKF